MSLRLLTILTWALLGSIAPASCSQADWDIYEVHGNTSLEDSIELVRNCPVSYYFDTQKGYFRVGFLAGALNESYAQFLVNIPRLVRTADNSMETVNVPSVDVTSLFSRAMPVIQYLGETAEITHRQIEDFKREKDDFALKIIRIATDTGTEWRTANEIKAAREVLQRRLDGLQEQLQNEEKIQDLKRENVRLRHQKRRAMRDHHHEQLLALRKNYEAEMVALKLQRQNESLAFSKEMQSGKYEEKQRLIEEEYRFATEQLKTDIEMSISAIRFRGQEESRVERENEAVTVALLMTKGELQVQRVQAVVDTFFIELETKLRLLFEDPRIVGIGAFVIVMILMLIVVLTELFNSGKAALRALLRRNSLLTQVGTVSASSASAGQGDLKIRSQLAVSYQELKGDIMRTTLCEIIRSGVVVSSRVQNQLADITASMLLSKDLFSAATYSRSETQNGYCLPNILISGFHGNGKSLAASLLVRCSGIEFAMVSGNDLRAHGSGADRTLRNILEACVAKSEKSNRQFVLVIDDVDAIALTHCKSIDGTRSPAAPGSRKRRKSLNGSFEDRVITDMTSNLAPAMKACIHLLLHAFKNSSKFLGLIATSTAPVEALNEALLDRMDHIVCIETPTLEQRLECCLRQTKELLFEFIINSQKKKFEQLCDTVLVGRDFSIVAEKIRSAETPKRGRRNSIPKKAAQESVISEVDDVDISQADSATSELDIIGCIVTLANSSVNWSYRDVSKTIQSIQCEVLGTDKCSLTTKIWMQEVKLAVKKWER